MSDDEQRGKVIRYWWSQAEESLASARRELEAGAYAFAVNRLYYAAFYGVSAALLERQLAFKKHSGVRAALHREFIKPGWLDVEWGKLYDQLFEDRQEGDYVALISFDREYVLPYLFLPLFVLLPLAVLSRSTQARVVICVPCLIFLLLYGELFLPKLARVPHPGGRTLTVMSYNVTMGLSGVDQILSIIESENPDVIGLQELSPEVAEALSELDVRSPFPLSELTTFSIHRMSWQRRHTSAVTAAQITVFSLRNYRFDQDRIINGVAQLASLLRYRFRVRPGAEQVLLLRQMLVGLGRLGSVRLLSTERLDAPLDDDAKTNRDIERPMEEQNMTEENPTVYPYIPNSVPAVKKQMLKEVGAKSVEDFYEEVPEKLRFRESMNLPKPLLSEYALKRHVEGILARNKTTGEYLSFLGAGCWQHHVPAVCDEVNRRGEFLTAYAGEPYDDHGRFQALFEYASMMGELLNMDVVNVPTYDGFQATATSLRMACRLTGRRQVLIARTISADLLSRIRDYCKPNIEIKLIGYDSETGQLDLDALKAEISAETAAVYFENPSYLGFIETRGDEISQIAHDHGAICVVGADPISLGVLTPPADYGADIVCGDIQPLGMRMQFGGGQAGYIATRDEEKYVTEYPSRLFGIAPTSVPGEYGFGDVAYERTSFAVREGGKEWVGTAAALWGITAGVYLALMGPQGMVEIGEGIMARARYAMLGIDKIDGVKAPVFQSPHFKEFVVNFDGTGKTVAEINKALLAREIFGGKDLTKEFPELGNSALYCVTEVHTKDDIDRLVDALKEVVE